MSETASETPSGPKLRLGTFLGVFTPTVLTILGVIMYLRLGWVVGTAGLGGALAIILFANVITIITALSLSSLATNMHVGIGGAYYIISRSLGLEAGGAIGIPLYLSQTLSLTLYAYGLAESMRFVWPGVPVPLFAGLIVIGVSAIAARSTELALKLQLPIMVCIALSLVSLFVGVEWSGPQVPIIGTFEGASFWMVFAVFFPAVTGILAGVSMSGDLADPGFSIPWGVISAVAVGAAVYLAVPFALANGAPTAELMGNSLVWTDIASVSWLVMPGLFGAILSSALGSILAAPRTLQALANDRLAPAVLGRTDPKTGEPIIALYLSGGVALAAVLLGDLNAVASVLTMFFLTTYGTLNLVAGLEALVGDPSFRPRLKVPWLVSFVGAAGCMVAILAINPLAGTVAIVIEAFIFWFLSRRALQATWGDVRTGLWHAMARYALLQLRTSRPEPRNWRPHILVFTGDMTRNVPMVRLASALNQERGIVTVSTLLEGDIEDFDFAQQIVARNQRVLEEEGILAFCEVAAVSDIDAGTVTVSQANGFAGLSSNTVMFGWPGEDPDRLGRLLGLARRMEGLGKCTLMFRPQPVRDVELRQDVVVWWKGREHNGDLMLLLAHLLSLDSLWRDARVVLKTVAADDEEASLRAEEFRSMLEDIRIKAHVSVVVRPAGASVADVIRSESQAARLVFLGMVPPPVGGERAAAEGLLDLLRGLPTTVLVRNSGPFRGRLV